MILLPKEQASLKIAGPTYFQPITWQLDFKPNEKTFRQTKKLSAKRKNLKPNEKTFSQK
jgi:hypothetical protein